jgi:hypothetical protein
VVASVPIAGLLVGSLVVGLARLHGPRVPVRAVKRNTLSAPLGPAIGRADRLEDDNARKKRISGHKVRVLPDRDATARARLGDELRNRHQLHDGLASSLPASSSEAKSSYHSAIGIPDGL